MDSGELLQIIRDHRQEYLDTLDKFVFAKELRDSLPGCGLSINEMEALLMCPQGQRAFRYYKGRQRV